MTTLSSSAKTTFVNSTALSVRDKFVAAHREITAKLVERDEETTISLVAIIAREHVLLTGEPGTAKSLLVESLAKWVSGAEKPFTYLLTKFTEPDELFGPVSVVGMQVDDYRRITVGKLPEATFAFLDEYWRGSSAIINTTLTVMNERKFQNGLSKLECPLQSMFAASNNWPNELENGQELNAAFDRFLFRKFVRPVGAAGRKKLLRERDHTPRFAPEVQVTPAEIDQAHAEATALPISDEAWAALDQILAKLTAAGIHPGDRRLVKSVTVAQAFAWLHGAKIVKPEHLEILMHVLWVDPTEQPGKVAAIVAKHSNPVGLMLNQFLADAEDIRANVDANKLDVDKISHVIVASQKLQGILKNVRELDRKDVRVQAAEERLKELVKEVRDLAI